MFNSRIAFLKIVLQIAIGLLFLAVGQNGKFIRSLSTKTQTEKSDLML